MYVDLISDMKEAKLDCLQKFGGQMGSVAIRLRSDCGGLSFFGDGYANKGVMRKEPKKWPKLTVFRVMFFGERLRKTKYIEIILIVLIFKMR